MSGERGFAYIFLLIVVAVIAGASANSLSQGSNWGRRHSEQELLVVGQAFEAALHSYAGQRQLAHASAEANVNALDGPASLEELLLDPRTSHTLRHLRKLFADPITGRREWGVVRNNAGQIVGVYSLSEAEPIKRSGFPPSQAYFAKAKSYRDWVFGLPGASLMASADRTATPPPGGAAPSNPSPSSTKTTP
ncbi:type II secretion system protein [Hydrogenophaga luteola]|uniref:Type II secretion system protein n=1 Tax=Hydrogenophaga luteola TaxID=1591122 RepID=A0ABV7W4I1_9BURK